MPAPESLLRASFPEETDQAFLPLLTIDHDEFAAPIRVTGDSRDTVSRGQTFVAYPFEVTLPAVETGVPPVIRLRIDNIDREITAALRSANARRPAQVMVEMVLSGSPDEVVQRYTGFQLEMAAYDVMTVEGEVGLKHFEREPYPAWEFTPGRFPALYRQL